MRPGRRASAHRHFAQPPADTGQMTRTTGAGGFTRRPRTAIGPPPRRPAATLCGRRARRPGR
jgi:hypothetical protein